MRTLAPAVGTASPMKSISLALALLLGASVEDPLAELAVKLRSGNKWVRQDAVEALGKIGSRKAFELVLGALPDEKGEVADTAELVLGETTDLAIVEELLDDAGLCARDPWVRRRAAELCGRLSVPVRTRELLRALADDDAETRRMIAWSIERRARGGRVEEKDVGPLASALERTIARDREPLVRARALAARAVLDPATALECVQAASVDREALVRAAASSVALEALGERRAEELFARLAGDEDLGVRRVTVRALCLLGTRAAAGVLVDRLGLETEPCLARIVLEDLRKLSGLPYRRDAGPWRAWLAALPSDWRAGAEALPIDPRGTYAPDAPSPSSFAGLPLYSERISILIDLSGSIWMERAGGKTKKQIIDAKLREALEGLPESTRFNLIPYTDDPLPWSARLESATPKNVARALAFFEERRENGSGNAWDALELALADTDVDTLVLLSDGEPTGGRRHRLELMVPLALERLQFRGIAVDAILVDAAKKTRDAWGDLAAGTGGRVLAIHLE